MPSLIESYLNLLDDQREAIFSEMSLIPDAVLWYRPGPKVWSIDEHLDHTSVINCCGRRLKMAYFPLASVFARMFRHRPYQAELDNDYKRPEFPMNVGWIWPPKYTPKRQVSVGFLHDALRKEHAVCRRFYTTHDEQFLGHVVLIDPFLYYRVKLGALNLVQCLRMQAYHDAHHFERIRIRISDPRYANRALIAIPRQR